MPDTQPAGEMMLFVLISLSNTHSIQHSFCKQKSKSLETNSKV